MKNYLTTIYIFLVAIYVHVQDASDQYYRSLGWIPLLVLMILTICQSNLLAICLIVIHEVFPTDIRKDKCKLLNRRSTNLHLYFRPQVTSSWRCEWA